MIRDSISEYHANHVGVNAKNNLKKVILGLARIRIIAYLLVIGKRKGTHAMTILDAKHILTTEKGWSEKGANEELAIFKERHNITGDRVSFPDFLFLDFFC